MFASPAVVVAARVGQPNLGRPPILFQGNVPSVLGVHSRRDECAIVTSPVHPSLLIIAVVVFWAERLRLDEEDRNQKMALTKTEHSEITESQVLALPGSVNYQDGSVVSRVILKRDKGSVTVFAFDEGQGLSEHTSPFEALVHGIEGRGEVIIAGKPLTLGEGEILLFAPRGHMQ